MRGDAVAERHDAQREVTAREPLGRRHNVRHDAAVLKGEELAGAAPPTHDLVAHEENAVPIEQRLQLRQVARGWWQNAVGSRHRLDDHGSDGVGALVRDDLRRRECVWARVRAHA